MTATAWKVMILIWTGQVLYYGVFLYFDPQTWRFWIVLMYLFLAVLYAYQYNKRKMRGDFDKSKTRN